MLDRLQSGAGFHEHPCTMAEAGNLIAVAGHDLPMDRTRGLKARMFGRQPDLKNLAEKLEDGMHQRKQTYQIRLCYDAMYTKMMEVEADSLTAACALAAEQADDDCDWEDSLESSSHWIGSINGDTNVVPPAYSEQAIRFGEAPVSIECMTILTEMVHIFERDGYVSDSMSRAIARAERLLATNHDAARRSLP